MGKAPDSAIADILAPALTRPLTAGKQSFAKAIDERLLLSLTKEISAVRPRC
ncbi:protein of unknown function (plasmid) [Caballeronia sp. S22]